MRLGGGGGRGGGGGGTVGEQSGGAGEQSGGVGEQSGRGGTVWGGETAWGEGGTVCFFLFVLCPVTARQHGVIVERRSPLWKASLRRAKAS